jgi:hypothetical protein
MAEKGVSARTTDLPFLRNGMSWPVIAETNRVWTILAYWTLYQSRTYLYPIRNHDQVLDKCVTIGQFYNTCLTVDRYGFGA